MIRVRCHTNLDLAGERWPVELPAVPRVGDLIQSAAKHGVFRLSLQVVRVSWECAQWDDDYVPHIELHMTETQKRLPASREGAAQGSIVAFYEWYAPRVGRSVSSFI